jgi:hypothetical protein
MWCRVLRKNMVTRTTYLHILSPIFSRGIRYCVLLNNMVLCTAEEYSNACCVSTYSSCNFQQRNMVTRVTYTYMYIFFLQFSAEEYGNTCYVSIHSSCNFQQKNMVTRVTIIWWRVYYLLVVLLLKIG